MTTPRSDDTTSVPWARTQTLPYAAPAAPDAAGPVAVAPVTAAPQAQAGPVAAPDDPQHAALGDSQVAPGTAPALDPPTWSGRKTAIAAALAIGFSSMGAVAAAAALPAGTTQGGGQVQQGGFGPGGRQQGGFTQQGTQQGGTSQLPGGQLPQGPGGGGPGSLQQAPGGTSQAPGTQLQQQGPADPSASTT